MRPNHLLWLAVLLLPVVPVVRLYDARSVRPVEREAGEAPRFDPSQSAALFVGIRKFTHDRDLTQVRFAVDDAVDLAHAFSLDRSIALVPPDRVALALSGTPQKEESKRRLADLKAAGARIESATEADILTLLQQQAATAGPGGLMIAAFATHGFNQHGTPYVLAETSIFRHPETALSTAKLFEIVATSNARRSLILVDACRERVSTGARGGVPEPASAAALIEGMSRVEGQVVLYAAAAGKYAYDDDRRRNGVFTAAVLEGLQCGARAGARGLVTFDSLARYVETEVRAWIRKNRDPAVQSAIQVVMDGGTRAMPLAVCSSRAEAIAGIVPGPDSPRPSRVAIRGADIEVFDRNGSLLWRHGAHGAITHAEVADLSGDGASEVVLAVGAGITVLDAAGRKAWAADTNGNSNYGSATSRMRVVTFTTGPLFRGAKTIRQIVALSVDETRRSSRITIFDATGRLLSSYWHPGPLKDVVIGKPTSRHAPKIIAFGMNDDLRSILDVAGPVASIFVLDPKKVSGESPPYAGAIGTGSQLWYGTVLPPAESIASLELIDHDNDGRRDIGLTTSGGHVLYVDFEGQIVGMERANGARTGVQFGLIAPK